MFSGFHKRTADGTSVQERRRICVAGTWAGVRIDLKKLSNFPVVTHAVRDRVGIGTLGCPLGLRSGVAKLCKLFSRIVSKTLLVLLA